MNREQFRAALTEKGMAITEQQMQQFATYYRQLIEWNKKMNLTSVTDENEVYVKHFFDSVAASFFVDFRPNQSIIDVGSGAGFPGIPLVIYHSHLQLTIVDSLQKRIRFLEHLADTLHLHTLTFRHDRAETAGHDPDLRGSFDVAVARAVSRLPVLLELCLPFVRIGGRFIAYKGQQGTEELEASARALSVLGAEVEDVHSFELPVEHAARQIIVLRKTDETPSTYPRQAGTPKRDPL